MPSPPAQDPPESPRSARLVFFVVWLLLLVSLLFPAAPVLGLHGGLLCVLGGLMIACPPAARLPKWIFIVGGLFLLFSAAAFLPKTWFTVSEWRQGLEATGLDTGNKVTAHPSQSWWQWAQLCGIVLAGIYVLGQRVSDRAHLQLAVMFPLAVGAMAVCAIAAQTLGWNWPWDEDPSFGFFPNRNHTATVLAMGSVTALGCLFQSVRSKHHGLAGLAALSACVCLGATLAFCPSRAGLLLTVVGILVWVAGLGKRYFSRKLVFAGVGMLIVSVALFFWLDGEVKSRLAKTAERVQTTMNVDVTDASQTRHSNETTADFRLLIYKDAWTMIKQEPVTGVGLGMFSYVFPQYRNASASAALCVHPESDWLMLAGEQGIIAALLLAGGVMALLGWAVRSAWHRHAWPLRWNGVVVAALVPFHGLLDVPGHRWGIVLGALYLLTLTLRTSHLSHALGSSGKMIWRGLGMLLLGCGSFFVWAGNDSTSNALTLPDSLHHEAKALYAQDAAEQGLTPPPDPEGLKLEKGIKLLEEAIRITPLDPDLHYLRGYLALHFTDDKFVTMRDQNFALQRQLAPLWVQIPMRQADVYAPVDSGKTIQLWEDAFRRADVMNKLGPGTDWERFHVIERAIYQSDKADAALKAKALELAKTDAREFVVWSHRGTLEELNQLLPEMLAKPMFTAAQREQLLQIWQQKGGTEGVVKYRAAHP